MSPGLHHRPRWRAGHAAALAGAAALAALLAPACRSAPPCPAAANAPSPPTRSAPDAVPAPPAPGGEDAAARAALDARFLRDLAETRSYRLGEPTSVRLLPDGSRVLFLRAGARRPVLGLFALDVATGQVTELLGPERVPGGAASGRLDAEEAARRQRMRVTSRGVTEYAVSSDGRTAIASLDGRLFALDLAAGPLAAAPRELAGPAPGGGGAPVAPRLAPDGRRVAFVRDGDLHVVPVAGGTPRRLTLGGGGDVTHGLAEFVAAEEMLRYDGAWWSPDARHLVYARADTSGVEKVRLVDPAAPEAPAPALAFPRAGRANAEVTLGVVRATGGATTWIDWDRARYPYLANVVWAAGAPLTIVVQSRDQREVVLYAADPATGRTRELHRERDEAWVNLDNVYAWLGDGAGFLWSTERGGAWQLEHRAPDGRLVRVLTPPELGVRALLHVDARAGAVIVAAEPTPVERQLVEVALADGAIRPLTRGPAAHAAVFARDTRAHVRTTTSLEAWPRHEVFRADGARAGELPGAAERPPALPRVEVALVGDPPGLWTALVRPHDFDPRRRYPVLLDVYGGPGVNHVRRAAGAYLLDQWIADHGYLVARVDGRGTPGRGRAWERALAGALGEVPLADQVAGLRALAAREPAMDLGRVGVFGHSFGGYLAARAVLARPDVFRAGVAASPVADWRDYDTHYSERYLGVPGRAGGAAPAVEAAYDAASLLPLAPRLARPLLLVHGTVDDNVHFRHALALADALFRAGRHVELVPLAGQTHLLVDPAVTIPYYARVFAFLEAHLAATTPAGAAP